MSMGKVWLLFWGCEVRSLPTTYLGMLLASIFFKKKRKTVWEPILKSLIKSFLDGKSTTASHVDEEFSLKLADQLYVIAHNSKEGG